ncbi:MAG: thiamine pyrophosphate-binding protein [Deltaproteobacteria bacterium]|nr:thiamine pyrophosphate-binding protein [Deltaproteobacteria bacterium]
MIVGDKLAEILTDIGVEYVFGVPGGQTLPLYEGIRKLEGRIGHVLMRDERSAGFAADAYARVTGRAGVCDATVGPGATNLVSAMAEAYCSSIPVIAIISDISTTWEHLRERGNASQAMRQLEMFSTCSKWQVRITDPRALENTIERAFRVATTGKPGPVVVSVPDNIARADFNFRDREISASGSVYPGSRSAPDPEDVDRAAHAILGANRPALVVGGGAHISGSYQKVKDLAEHLSAAVITSISGKGIIEETHPQAFGVTGTFGNPVAREVMRDADLILFIGCKAGQLTTFGYQIPGKNTPVVHLDSDPEEIGRIFGNSFPLVGDANMGIDSIMNTLVDTKPTVNWDFKSYKKMHEQWVKDITSQVIGSEGRLRPQAVMGVVNKALTDDDMVVCDASLSSGWAASLLHFPTAGRNIIAPRGLAGLGWGSPATVGAAMALKKKKRVLQFAGDGGFAYSVAELEVMNRLGLPVVSFVFNNDTFGWIKHSQKNYYRENYISVDFAHIDFGTVAKGFGARGYTVKNLDELQEALDQEKSPQGPAVIEIVADQWETPVQGPK